MKLLVVRCGVLRTVLAVRNAEAPLVDGNHGARVLANWVEHWLAWAMTVPVAAIPGTWTKAQGLDLGAAGGSWRRYDRA